MSLDGGFGDLLDKVGRGVGTATHEGNRVIDKSLVQKDVDRALKVEVPPLSQALQYGFAVPWPILTGQLLNAQVGGEVLRVLEADGGCANRQISPSRQGGEVGKPVAKLHFPPLQ